MGCGPLRVFRMLRSIPHAGAFPKQNPDGKVFGKRMTDDKAWYTYRNKRGSFQNYVTLFGLE